MFLHYIVKIIPSSLTFMPFFCQFFNLKRIFRKPASPACKNMMVSLFLLLCEIFSLILGVVLPLILWWDMEPTLLVPPSTQWSRAGAECLPELTAGLNQAWLSFQFAEGFSTISELSVDSSWSQVLVFIWVGEKRGWEGWQPLLVVLFMCFCGWDVPKKSSRGLSLHGQILACYVQLL